MGFRLGSFAAPQGAAAGGSSEAGGSGHRRARPLLVILRNQEELHGAHLSCSCAPCRSSSDSSNSCAAHVGTRCSPGLGHKKAWGCGARARSWRF